METQNPVPPDAAYTHMTEMSSPAGEVTQLIRLLGSGQQDVQPRLIELIYDELRRIAASRMKSERPEHTLTPTALVHEAYIRLGSDVTRHFQDRAHFFAVVAQAMRRVLVDHARTRSTLKRDARAAPPLPDWMLSVGKSDEEILALDAALHRLTEINPRQSSVVELRYFAGLTEDQVAAVLGIARRTVNRDWQMAKAWLYNELSEVRE
jgi:RNA polymerase sigma-70 factor, ECF subfamily